MSRLDELPSWVRDELEATEPDLALVASYGTALLPVLEELVSGANELLALRAVHIAGMLGATGASIISTASRDPRPAVRVASAGALRYVQDPTMLEELREVAERLTTDPDPSVRRWIAKSAGLTGFTPLEEHLQKLSTTDSEPSVRDAAQRSLQQLRGSA